MTTELDTLHTAIADRTARVGVVGLGYVGLPLACAIAEAGFRVIGIDIDPGRVERISDGASPIDTAEPGLDKLLARVVAERRLLASTDYSDLDGAEIVTMNVQTPVDSNNRPDTSALRAASSSLGSVIRRGTLVVVESTVAPGTTAEVVRPAIENSSGFVDGESFYLGVCPERVMPGRLLANIRHVARVCGASRPDVTAVMRAFYETIVEADIDTTTLLTAELVKVTENAYRDVQIAFANELSLICRDLGVDVWHVRELVNKVPERNVHRPGGGVGGHCIPKDPWLLAASSPSPLRLIPAARAINDSIPRELAVMAEDAAAALADVGLDPDRAQRVLVLGYSYLPESDDTRNSPSADLVEELEKRGLQVTVHDPIVPGFQIDLEAALADAGIAITMVPHASYAGMKIDVPFHLDAEKLALAAGSLRQIREAADA